MLPCYLVTLLPCYLVTLLPCYSVPLLSCYSFTLLSCYLVRLLLCYLVPLFPCYSVTLLLCYHVTLLLCLLLPCYSVTLLPCYSVTLLLCYLLTLLLCYLVTLLPCGLNFSLFLYDKSQLVFPDWMRFFGVWSWLNGLHYNSFFVYGNQQQSALFGTFFLFDGNQTKVSFFENSAWTMTKALCLNAIAPEAFYSFFWQYFYDQIFCIKR